MTTTAKTNHMSSRFQLSSFFALRFSPPLSLCLLFVEGFPGLDSCIHNIYKGVFRTASSGVKGVF